MQISFDELEQKVGLGLAVILFKGVLPTDFFNSLTFEEWAAIYNDIPFNDSSQRNAWLEMLCRARTFDQWLTIFHFANYIDDTEVRHNAWVRMLELANLEQLLKIYREECPVGTEIRRHVFEKIVAMVERPAS